jgi:hypothetical protein
VGIDDIEQGELLWITPNLCKLPELDDAGFALRVVQFLGWDYDDRPSGRRFVWVYGLVLLDTRGRVLRGLQLSVPVDQPRAVPAGPVYVQAPAPGAGRSREW